MLLVGLGRWVRSYPSRVAYLAVLATTLKVAAHLLAVLPKRQPQKVETKLEPLKSIRGSSSLRLEDPPR